MHQREIDELANNPMPGCRSLEERFNAYYRVNPQLQEQLTRLFINPETMRQAEFLLHLLQHAEPGPRFPTRARGESLLSVFQTQHPEFRMSWDELMSSGWIRCFYSSWTLPASQISSVLNVSGSNLLHEFLHLLKEEFISYKLRLERYPRVTRKLYQEKLAELGISQKSTFLTEFITETDDSCIISFSELHSAGLVSWLFAQLWQSDHSSKKLPNDDARFEWWVALVLAAEIYPLHVPTFLHSPESIITIGVKRLFQESDVGSFEDEKKKASAMLALEYGQSDIVAYYENRNGGMEFKKIRSLTDYCDKSFVWDSETAALMSYVDDINQKMEGGIIIHRVIISWLLEWEGKLIGAHCFSRSIPLIQRILLLGENRPRLIEYFIDQVLHTGINGHPSILPYLLVIRENLNVVGLGLALIARQQSNHFAIFNSRGIDCAQPMETLAIHREVWRDSVRLALATFLERGAPGLVGTPPDLSAHHCVAAEHLVAIYTQLVGEVRPQANPWSVTHRPRWLEERIEIFLQLLEGWPSPFDRTVSVLVPLLPALVSAVKQRLEAVAGQPGTLHRPEITLLLWLLRRPCLGPACEGWSDAVIFLGDEYTRPTDPGYRTDFPIDSGWICAVRWLAQNQSEHFLRILRPRDFPSAIHSLIVESEKPTYGRLENSIRGHLRLHLRFLAFLLENWEQDQRIPCDESNHDKLTTTFSDYLCSNNQEARSDGFIDTFKIIAGLDPDESRGMKPLMSSIGRAISAMRTSKQLEIIRLYLERTQEPRRLGQLYGSLSNPEIRRLVRNRLASCSAHNDIVKLNYPSAIEIFSIIDALLDAALPEHAEGYLARHGARIQELWKGEWESEALRLKLRCELTRGNLQPLLVPSLPDGIAVLSETNATRQFYRAIALMRQAPSDYAAAAKIFANLSESNPIEDVYAVNWLAARTGEVTSFPTDREPLVIERTRMMIVIGETEKFIIDGHPIAKTEQFCQNYLYLLRRLGENDRLMRFFHGLPADWQQKPDFYAHINHISSETANRHGEESSLSSKQRRTEIRKQINRHCKSDSDLEALFTDFFQPVHQQAGGGMTRDQKVTLLLQMVPIDVIADALKEYCSERPISEIALVSSR